MDSRENGNPGASRVLGVLVLGTVQAPSDLRPWMYSAPRAWEAVPGVVAQLPLRQLQGSWFDGITGGSNVGNAEVRGLSSSLEVGRP